MCAVFTLTTYICTYFIVFSFILLKRENCIVILEWKLHPGLFIRFRDIQLQQFISIKEVQRLSLDTQTMHTTSFYFQLLAEINQFLCN